MERTARQIVQTLQTHGHQAVFAGGCVRDTQMGITPHDFDIATSATPDQVETLFRNTKAVGKAFGVILVNENGMDFEVATFRTDGDYTDGRRPDSIEFATMEEDAQRRDFTINGMFMDPIRDHGQLIDHVNGMDDLLNCTIRFIGDPNLRIQEDKLRMLRAIRFALRFNFEIDPASWTAIQLKSIEVNQIAPERIQEELVKIFREGKPRKAMELLMGSGIAYVILPELTAMHHCQQNPAWHAEGDVLEHTIRVMESIRSKNWNEEVSDELIWAALLHDVGKPPTTDDSDGTIRTKGHAKVGSNMTRCILAELKFPNAFIDRVSDLVEDHMLATNAKHFKRSTLRRFIGKEHYADLIQLAIADCEGTEGAGKSIDIWLPFLMEKEDEFINEPVLPPPLLTGKDLIELGMVPGPLFKEILEAVSTEQLEGNLNDSIEALEFVISRW